MRFSGWAGFTLALMVLFGAASMVFDIRVILGLPSLLIVVGWTFAIGMMAFGGKRLLSGVKALIVLFSESNRPSAATDILVLQSLRQNLYVGGMLGVLFGVAGILSELSDPSMIGPDLAMTLGALVYATVLAELFCRPAIERMEGLAETDDS